MQTDRLAVHFLGPYSWLHGVDAPSVFVDPVGAKCGVYLWTVAIPEGELIYYVGETGRSFRHRLFEHLKEHLAGAYHVYEPEAFLRGEKVALWPGIYGQKRDAVAHDLVEHYLSLAPAIVALARAYRFFLAPLDCEQRIRERAEAAIANHLSNSPRNFQDAGIRYRPRRPTEPSLALEITSSRSLVDVPAFLDA